VLTSGAAAPSGTSAQAIARWIQSLGGKVRRGDKGIESISLARVRFTDQQVKYLVSLHGLEQLSLEATDVSDAAMDALCEDHKPA
jgi:hypothetical protein